MRFVLELKDKRINFVGEYLKNNGNEVVEFSSKAGKLGKGDICVVSPAHKWDRGEVEQAQNADLCLGGKIDEIFLNKFKKYVNMLCDEDFAIKNAMLTAEATLFEIYRITEKSLQDTKTLILGSGRIAKSLWKIFDGLGVKFDVAMRNEKERILSQIVAENSFRLENISLQNYDLIINTIPAKLFDSTALLGLKNNYCIIELASIPCIDSTDGINFVLCGGLPGKILCKSAGKVVLNKLLEEIKRI